MRKKTDWNKKIKDEDLKIRHFSDQNGLVATLITGPHPLGLAYGVAVVNPIDNPDKELGRKIAYIRLLLAYKANDFDKDFIFEPFIREDNSLFHITEFFIIGKYGVTTVEEIKRVIKIYHNKNDWLKKLPLKRD